MRPAGRVRQSGLWRDCKTVKVVSKRENEKKKSVNIHSVHRSYLLVVLCNFVCMCNKIIPTVKYEIIKEKLVKST